MPSLIPGYVYDIFISYRQKDNKHDGWVTEFVDNLKGELESTFKEEISVYFDINPHDGLLETHDVDASLKDKLKCLVFIPIISRTYCDPKAFAWEHEFKAFVEQASKDDFGLKIRLASGNVASRVLPVQIHDLDDSDMRECESVTGGFLRGIEFIYKSQGVNRPLRVKEDNPQDNKNHTIYRDQINKVALAIKDIIHGMRMAASPEEVTDKEAKVDHTGKPGDSKMPPEKGTAENKSPEEKPTENKPPEKKHNLPVSTTRFIGREKEVKEVRDLFQKSRLVTLTGAGGSGKTRLAREVAITFVEDFKDGVWFADLSPVTDPDMVGKTIAGTLGIDEVPGKPILDTLTENITQKSLLLLLDNCEQVIDACAEIEDKLLHSGQGICILATSREALNIPGEVVWSIPTLSFPDPGLKIDIEKAGQFDAIRLFADRAGLSKPGFTINDQNISQVAGICQRLDGIPLAIELAAARVRHLEPVAILERLKDRFNVLNSSSRALPGRHRTMQAVIEWSHHLLSEEEKILFMRLGVFSGGFDLVAAEEICAGESLPADNMLDLLSRLVDKSMIQIVCQPGGEMRYRMLETLQSHALRLLVESGEVEEIRELHLGYFTRMVEKAYQEQFESSTHWTLKLKQEHDNLIGALNWADHYKPEGFRLLVGYLALYWVFLGINFSSGKYYLEKAISKSSEETEVFARNLSLLGYSKLIILQDSETAIRLLNKSLSLWQRFKNPFEEAIVLGLIGLCYTNSRDFKNSLKYSGRSLALARKVGKPGLINMALVYYCWSKVHSFQFSAALPFVEELMASSEKMNYVFGIAIGRHFHSDCALGIKDFVEAERRYGLGSQTAFQLGIPSTAYFDIQGVAFALSGQQRWAKSLRLNAVAVKCFQSIGFEAYGLWPMWDAFIDTYIGQARKAVGEEMAKKYEQEGMDMDYETALAYALDTSRD